jgi:hypothetical protein
MDFENFKKEAIKHLPEVETTPLTPTEENILRMRYNEGYTPEEAADNIKYGDWLEEYIYDIMEI